MFYFTILSLPITEPITIQLVLHRWWRKRLYVIGRYLECGLGRKLESCIYGANSTNPRKLGDVWWNRWMCSWNNSTPPPLEYSVSFEYPTIILATNTQITLLFCVQTKFQAFEQSKLKRCKWLTLEVPSIREKSAIIWKQFVKWIRL